MLQAAAAQVDITPPVGAELCGYSARPTGAVGIHDPLFARALVLEEGDTRAALVTADLIGWDAVLVGEIRRRVQAQGIMPGGNVMLTATHTHAGPMISCLSRMGTADPEYVERLAGEVTRLIIEAAGRLSPVRVGWGVGQAVIGINRRQFSNGKVIIGTNPQGPVDPDVGVLVLRGQDGAPLAMLINHACHGTTMGPENCLVSADWPGAAVREVAEAVPGAVVMLANGCCGDLNPEPRGENFALVQVHGETVARAVLAALGEAKYAEAGLRVHSEPVTIPLQPLPPLEEAEGIYADCLANLRQAEGGDDLGAKRLARGMYQWAADLLRHAQAGTQPDPPSSEVMALGLGEVALVGLPGEPFVEYGLDLKRRSPFPCTMVLGYANRLIGYLPTPQAFSEGGYEVEGAARWYGVAPLVPETQHLISKAALAALRAVAR